MQGQGGGGVGGRVYSEILRSTIKVSAFDTGSVELDGWVET